MLYVHIFLGLSRSFTGAICIWSSEHGQWTMFVQKTSKVKFDFSTFMVMTPLFSMAGDLVHDGRQKCGNKDK
jgi:hypothetical protein